MARIRTIKPEFPQSESMGRVTRESRYCFILLWTLADDSGRLRGNSRMLASLLYPYDLDAGKLIDKWLVELEREKCLVRYTIDGDNYIQICNWLKHQKIDKPSASKIPAFVEDSRILSNPRELSCEDQGSRKGSKDQGKEGNELGEPAKAVRKKLPIEFKYKDSHKEKASLYGIDMDDEFEAFQNYHKAKGTTMLDWDQALFTWINNARRFGKPKLQKIDTSLDTYFDN
jgi:hypothetical protein